MLTTTIEDGCAPWWDRRSREREDAGNDSSQGGVRCAIVHGHDPIVGPAAQLVDHVFGNDLPDAVGCVPLANAGT